MYQGFTVLDTIHDKPLPSGKGQLGSDADKSQKTTSSEKSVIEIDGVTARSMPKQAIKINSTQFCIFS